MAETKVIFVDQDLNFERVQSKVFNNLGDTCIILPHVGELTLESMREKAKYFLFENFDEEGFKKKYNSDIPKDCNFQFEGLAVEAGSKKKTIRVFKRNNFHYKSSLELFHEERKEGRRKSTSAKKTSKGSLHFYRPKYSF